MLSTIFGKTADLLDKRFLVGLLLPCVGFVAAVGALAITGIGWDHTRSFWDSVSVAGRWAGGITAAAAVSLAAVLLGTQVNRLVAIWEGYWPKNVRWLGIQLERRRCRRLDDADPWESTRKLLEFPSEVDNFLPTRLGNVLLAAENYGRERYGLDSVFFWPRQYLLLSNEVRVIVDDARRAIDQLVVIATLSVLTVASALGLRVASAVWPTISAPFLVWVPSASGAAVLAYLTYRSAVSAAVTYGDLIRSVFDLYRDDLLAKLGVALPKSREIEPRVWQALGQQLLRGGTNSPDDDALIEYRRKTAAGQAPMSRRSLARRRTPPA